MLILYCLEDPVFSLSDVYWYQYSTSFKLRSQTDDLVPLCKYFRVHWLLNWMDHLTLFRRGKLTDMLYKCVKNIWEKEVMVNLSKICIHTLKSRMQLEHAFLNFHQTEKVQEVSCRTPMKIVLESNNCHRYWKDVLQHHRPIAGCECTFCRNRAGETDDSTSWQSTPKLWYSRTLVSPCGWSFCQFVFKIFVHLAESGKGWTQRAWNGRSEHPSRWKTVLNAFQKAYSNGFYCYHHFSYSIRKIHWTRYYWTI